MDFKFLQKKGKIIKTKEMLEESDSTKEIFENLTKEKMQEKKDALQEYYVPYAVDALQDGFEITIFPENLREANQLVIKYEIHNQKQTIILASTKEKNIQANKIRKALNQYFGERIQFASLEELEPEYYIEDLIKQGWELTKEGLDLFCTVRNDGELETKRTEFTNSELMSITQEQIEENERRHNTCVEQQRVIPEISTYIVNGFKQITSDDIKEMAATTPIRKVIEPYQMVLGYVNNEEQNELGQIFANMKPISDMIGNKETTLDIEDKLKAMSHDIGTISTYINQIPEKYQDSEKRQQILRYTIIRNAFVNAKQKGAIGRQEQDALKLYIRKFDEQEEKKKQEKREKMMISTRTLMARHNRGIDR